MEVVTSEVGLVTSAVEAVLRQWCDSGGELVAGDDGSGVRGWEE